MSNISVSGSQVTSGLILAKIASTGKWSDLQNATAALTLSNGVNGTEFDQTSGATWAWKNTTAATGSSAPTVIASQFISAAGTGGQANGSLITTTGATLLIAVMSIFLPTNGAGGLPTIADGLGNTWNFTPVVWSYGGQNMALRVAYAFSHAGGALSTGSDSFTVSIGGASSWTAAIYAVNNTLTTASVFDSAVGIGHNGGVIGVSPVVVGTITPSPGDIVVTNITNGTNVYTAPTINQGFGNVLNGAQNGAAAAIVLSATGETLNPTWTFAGGGPSFGQLVCFKAAATVPAVSPTHVLTGSYWNGSASATESWTLQNNPATGINGLGVMSLSHSGSSGGSQLQVPGLAVNDPLGGFINLNNTTPATATTVQNSPALCLNANYFYDGVSTPDSWTIQNVLATPVLNTITNVAESAASLVTLTTSATVNFSAAVTGTLATITGLTTATWLNGLTVALTTAAGTTITFTDPTSHGTLVSTPDSGTITQANPNSILALQHKGSTTRQIQIPATNAQTSGTPGTYPVLIAEGGTVQGISLSNNISLGMTVFASGSATYIALNQGAVQYGTIGGQITSGDTNFQGNITTTQLIQNAAAAAQTVPLISIGQGTSVNWASTSSGNALVGVNIGTKYNQVGDTSCWLNWVPLYGTSSFNAVQITPTINQAAITGTIAGVQVVGNVAVVNFQSAVGPMNNGATTVTVTAGTNTAINGAGNTITAITNRANQTITNSVATSVNLTLSAAANASGGTTAYTGTITNGGAALGGNYVGCKFLVAGFTNAANNGTFICTASTTTTLTLANAAGAAETHAATANFDNIVLTTGAGSAYAAGDYIYLTGLTVLTSLNGQVAKVLSAVAGTSVTFGDPTRNGTSGSQADTGTVAATWITFAKTTTNITLNPDTGTAVQQATGAFNTLFINPTVTATGASTSANKLIDCQFNSVDKFNVDSGGNVTAAGTITASGFVGAASSVGTGIPVPTGTKHEVVFNGSSTLSSSSGNNWPGGGWGTLGGTFAVNTNSSTAGKPPDYQLTSPTSGGAQLAENQVNNWFCMNIFSAYRVVMLNNDTTAGAIWWIGMTAGVGAGAMNVTNPNTTIWGFRYVQGTDTHWQAYVGTSNVAFTATDTGITPDTTLFHEYFVAKNSSGNLDYYIDGTRVATITSGASGFPSANTSVAPQMFVGVPSTTTSALLLYALQAWTKF